MFILTQKKPCSKCGELKSLDEFYKDSRSSDGKASECKLCHNKGTARWRSEHPDKSREIARNCYQNYPHQKKRNIWLERKYGIDFEKYQAMLDAQQGRCAICGKEQTDRSMHVDHDHKTGEIRGLLCSKCNRAIGYADDDPNILERAIEYLRKRK